jgi:hypothetical protein
LDGSIQNYEKKMTRPYYSSRHNPKNLTLEELYEKPQHLYLFFRDKDFFKERTGITKVHIPDAIQHEAVLELGFQPFPLTKWPQESVTEDNIFDTLEFLYDRISAPGELSFMTDETGWNYQDYEAYDNLVGQG